MDSLHVGFVIQIASLVSNSIGFSNLSLASFTQNSRFQNRYMTRALLDLLKRYLTYLFNRQSKIDEDNKKDLKFELKDLKMEFYDSRPLVDFAQTQGLAAVLFEILKQVDLQNKNSYSLLETQWLHQASAALARARLLAKYWPKDVPAPMLIKGADLELSLYEPMGFPTGIRACSDWDLLIPEPYYSAVIRDWQSRFGDGLVPKSARFKDEDPHELGFYVEGFLFEIHRDPAPLNFSSITGEKIWSARQSKVDAWGQKYYVPSPKDRLIIFLLNYGKSGGQTRLLNWLDLVMIIRALSLKEQSALFNNHSLTGTFSHPQNQRILKDVLAILESTPLIELLDVEINHQNESLQTNSLLLSSLQRHREKVIKAILQVSYCESKLRSKYIRAKILSL